MTGSGRRLGWDLLPLLGAIFAVASFLVHEIYSLDVWWQVTIGRDILQSGSIPSVDRYAAAALVQRERPTVTVVAGVNLPMLLDFVMHATEEPASAVSHAVAAGSKAISVSGP